MFAIATFALFIFYFAGTNANLTKPCVPTEKSEGPCHQCVCGMDGTFHCRRRTKCIEDRSANVTTSSQLKEIHDGESCEIGKMYQKECNICRCTMQKTLKCTMKNCLHSQEPKDKTKLDLPDLPSGPCVEGKLYKKGCRKCYCEQNKKAVCAATPVGPKCKLEIKSYREATPDDYGVKTKNIDMRNLPSLPNISTKCDPGLMYKVDCNVCICLFNSNLLCTEKLCLSIEDMNRLEAKRRTGLPCSQQDEKEEPCLRCRCIDDKLSCKPVEKCDIPARRRLHGEVTEQMRFPLTLDPTQECVPQSVYKINCNRCYCQEDGSLRCTSMTCLNYMQARTLQNLRS